MCDLGQVTKITGAQFAHLQYGDINSILFVASLRELDEIALQNN